METRRAGARLTTSPAIVGREDELAWLLEIASSAPAVIVVEGEAGIGKTRLITEALAKVSRAGRRCLVGACRPHREPYPLAPFVEALRSLDDLSGLATPPAVTGALRTLLPHLGGWLPPRPPPTGDARTDRHVLFRAVVELLGTIGPAVCVLEDLHWADDPTSDLLRYLVARMPHGLTLVGTCRPDGAGTSSQIGTLVHRLAPGVTAGTLTLEPLAVADVGRLAAVLLETDEVPEAAAAELHERTAGIPLAVEEVVRLLPERSVLAGLGRRRVRQALDALSVPATIGESVTTRLSRGSPATRRFVEAAAVLGVPAAEEVVARVAGLDGSDATNALVDGLATGVLVESPDDRYGVRHSLAAQAVYASIPRRELRRLHLRAAEAVAADGEASSDALARQLRGAGRWEEWAHHAELAADAAAELLNHEAAAGFLCDVLAMDGLAGEARPRLATKLAHAALSSASPPREAVPLLRAVLAADGLATEVRGTLRQLLGLLLIATGDASAGYREQERAVAELGGHPPTAVTVMLNLASPWVAEGHSTEHRRWLDEAVRASRACDDAATVLRVRIATALVPLYLGDPGAWPAAESLLRDPISAAVERQMVWGAANLAGACFHLGHYGRARDCLDAAARLAEAAGWGSVLHVPATAEILLDWVTGRWEGLARRARAHADDLSDLPGWSADSLSVVGALALARGEVDVAAEALGAAVPAALRGGIIPVAATAAGGLVRARLAASAPERACQEASGVLDVIRRKGIWVWAAELVPPTVDGLRTAGRTEAADTLVQEFAEGIAGRDAPLAEAALAMSEGSVAESRGRPGTAATAYERARAAFAALPRPHDAAMAAARNGSCRLSLGDAQGETPLREALCTLEALGAPADASSVRRTMRGHSLSVPRPVRSGRRSYGAHPSPRELEVVERAARGLTNAQIAAEMCISPRTVEHHLRAAMDKLGVRSRQQLRG